MAIVDDVQIFLKDPRVRYLSVSQYCFFVRYFWINKCALAGAYDKALQGMKDFKREAMETFKVDLDLPLETLETVGVN